MVSATDLVAPPRATTVSQVTAVEQARAVAEVMAAVQVAQSCPRSIVRAQTDMEAATARLALASRAFYSVPNRGAGPSVHLARELARIWGNIDYGVRELRRDDAAGESEVQAFAWDQQTNTRSTRSFIVPHFRTVGKGKDKRREKLEDLNDIYLSNQNIGARAVRECIYAVLPGDFVADAEDRCRSTLKKGDGKPLTERIADMLDAYKRLSVTEAQIAARIGRPQRDWDAQDLANLAIVFRSIQAGDTTVAEEFPAAAPTAAQLTAPPAQDVPGALPEATPAPDGGSGGGASITGSGPTPTPDPGTDAAPDGWVEPGEQLISGPQSKKLHVLLGRLGLGEREAGLAYINRILREYDPDAITLVSSKFLTRTSANRVIAALGAWEQANAEAAAEVDAEGAGERVEA